MIFLTLFAVLELAVPARAAVIFVSTEVTAAFARVIIFRFFSTLLDPLLLDPTRISSVLATDPVSVLYWDWRADLDEEKLERSVVTLVFMEVREVICVEVSEDTTVWVILVDKVDMDDE